MILSNVMNLSMNQTLSLITLMVESSGPNAYMEFLIKGAVDRVGPSVLLSLFQIDFVLVERM